MLSALPCRIEDDEGTIVTDKATITENDTNFLTVSFDDLPEDGTYRLVIASRDGESKDEYGVTRVERKVKVINA